MSISTESAGLYIVGTPIGNLEDVTLRAVRILRTADCVACEDTRKTARLLKRHGIQARTLSYFEHSPGARARQILEAARKGLVAVVSEAGTPAVSDPGSRLVEAAHREGIPVFAVPGPSSVTAALSVAGFPADRFIFEGFLARKPGKRRKALEAIAAQERTAVFFESPHRIEKTMTECVDVFGEREGVIVREATKLHEQVVRGTMPELLKIAAKNPRGEFTVVVGPPCSKG